MSSFLFFSSRSGYYKYMVDAVLAEDNTKVYQPIEGKISQALYRLHFAWPMNQKRELPLHSLWFKRLLKGMEADEAECVYVIMNENCLLSYSESFLKHLKKVYPTCKICFFFSNPVDDYILPKLSRVNKLYDAKITFFEDDAIKYGLTFTEMCPYKLPFFEKKKEISSDVFFVGKDKGRLDFLHKLYENLTAKGLVCDFNIVDVSEGDMKYPGQIHYNKWMSYDEVLRHIKSTKCVLEVLQNNYNYVSIKTYEALQYHKKLITTNISVSTRSFYNPKTILVLNSPDQDISDFLSINLKEEDFRSGEKYTTFDYFEKEIISYFSNDKV